MEYSFYKGKNCIIKKEPFEVFEFSIAGLTQKSYLALLLKYVIEHGASPFDKYFQFLLKQTRSRHQFHLAKNLENVTLLMTACKMTDLKTVEMLMGHKDIQIYKKDRSRKNIMHYAIENHNQEHSRDIIHLIINLHPQFVSIHFMKRLLGNFDNGSYITLCIEAKKLKILQFLLRNQVQLQQVKIQANMLHIILEGDFQQQIKLNLIKLLSSYGLTNQCLGKYEQNNIQNGIGKDELKGEQQVKLSTLETSPEQKLIDSLEQDFQEQISYGSQSSLDLQLNQLNHTLVSQEMFQLASKIQQARNATWAILHPFYLKLYQLVTQLYGTIQVIGSFASNLWIPNCDVDFLLIIPQNNLNFFDQLIELLYSKIKKLESFTYNQLYFGYKLPMIKLNLGSQYNHLQVQLFLSNKKNISSRYVTFIQQIVAYYPQIQIIYFVVRKILQAKLLHDHRYGGLKAYALFLLIYSMRSQYNYLHVSQFLQHFAYYYGFAYEYVGQLVEDEVAYKINIMDPLNNQNNMGGKKTDILGLQQVFKKVYYGLNMPSAGNKIDFIIDLIKDT